jgi:hypothetical protein
MTQGRGIYTNLVRLDFADIKIQPNGSLFLTDLSGKRRVSKSAKRLTFFDRLERQTSRIKVGGIFRLTGSFKQSMTC